MQADPTVTDITRDDFVRGWNALRAMQKPPGIVTSDDIPIVRGASSQGDLLAFLLEMDFTRNARTLASHVVAVECDSFWSDRDAILRSDRLIREYDGHVYVGYDLGLEAVVFLCVEETDAVALRMVLPGHVDEI